MFNWRKCRSKALDSWFYSKSHNLIWFDCRQSNCQNPPSWNGRQFSQVLRHLLLRCDVPGEIYFNGHLSRLGRCLTPTPVFSTFDKKAFSKFTKKLLSDAGKEVEEGVWGSLPKHLMVVTLPVSKGWTLLWGGAVREEVRLWTTSRWRSTWRCAGAGARSRPGSSLRGWPTSSPGWSRGVEAWWSANRWIGQNQEYNLWKIEVKIRIRSWYYTISSITVHPIGNTVPGGSLEGFQTNGVCF